MAAATVASGYTTLAQELETMLASKTCAHENRQAIAAGGGEHEDFRWIAVYIVCLDCGDSHLIQGGR